MLRSDRSQSVNRAACRCPSTHAGKKMEFLTKQVSLHLTSPYCEMKDHQLSYTLILYHFVRYYCIIQSHKIHPQEPYFDLLALNKYKAEMSHSVHCFDSSCVLSGSNLGVKTQEHGGSDSFFVGMLRILSKLLDLPWSYLRCFLTTSISVHLKSSHAFSQVFP